MTAQMSPKVKESRSDHRFRASTPASCQLFLCFLTQFAHAHTRTPAMAWKFASVVP